ncbi:Translin [Cordyceps fumosorosea ARSEF 2679]|uniref:Translin n=1 Tax=Cordyceps fumosorosea (strain ARSEF 2679) TaxID=1081104 RepID=A0A167PQE3_CORFA|nr:Translin [Cordyceps fumosorosea ARSEF 2679]OAA56919.1 Translin [Cordyceps fumosorosea ARSEF 2679]
MAQPHSSLLDPSIFASLETKLEEETHIRDALGQILQRLERSVGAAQGLLTKVHSTPRDSYPQLVTQLEAAVKDEAVIVSELDELASKHPYYKYNSRWSRTMQNAIGTVLYTAWLGGFPHLTSPSSTSATVGQLLTLEQVGAVFAVPVNIKDRDAFHLTIEEYLLALTDLTQELSRLATNAVTLGDFALPLTVSAFLKDLFAGFQLLNLKNDILRKRADAVKYDVKRVEDVVYDLSLRGLVPRPGAPAADAEMKSE